MCLLNGRLLNHLHLMFVSCKWWQLVFILAFAVRLRSHISKLIKPTDGQALNFIVLVIMHHNNTYHFHIQVCYSNVIVSSHVSLICVNILMARNMVSFDSHWAVCYQSDYILLKAKPFISAQKNNLSLMKWNITADMLLKPRLPLIYFSYPSTSSLFMWIG